MMSRLLVSLLLLASVVACTLHAPLGDPSQSKLDRRLDGVWILQKPDTSEQEVALVAPFDEHAYVIVYSRVVNEGGKPRLVARPLVMRGWLTNVGESQFLTVENVAQLLPSEEGRKAYILTRLRFVADALEVRLVDDKFMGVGELTDSSELGRTIAAHVADPGLLAEAQTFRRLRTDVPFEVALQKEVLDRW